MENQSFDEMLLCSNQEFNLFTSVLKSQGLLFYFQATSQHRLVHFP